MECYDYSENGAYFLTICTENKEKCLSHIVGGGVLDAPQVQLTEIGSLVDKQIREMDAHYEGLSVDKFVIMPNHLHLLVSVTGHGTSGTPSPTNAVIPQFVSTLKRLVHRQCGKTIFQRSYFDHVIRGREDYAEHWRYIEENPIKWTLDKYYEKNAPV